MTTFAFFICYTIYAKYKKYGLCPCRVSLKHGLGKEIYKRRKRMEKEIVVFSSLNSTLTAKINCEIDHHTAGRIRTRIDKELFMTRPKVLCLDFENVRFMDSSGIALILGRVESASAVGGRVHLDGLSLPLFKLIRLSGIEKIKNLTVSPAI